MYLFSNLEIGSGDAFCLLIRYSLISFIRAKINSRP